MTIDHSPDNSQGDISNSMEIDNKKVMCKDGFCFLPNQKEDKPIIDDNINIFDPI
tara:strand:+ start:10795 stop:10959 length:165 start_codon:yes stop_codon:yes gene_type:complete